jgi:hypothetical protein
VVRGLEGVEKAMMIKEVVADPLAEPELVLIPVVEHRPSSTCHCLDPGGKGGKFPAVKSCSHFALPDMILGVVIPQTPSLRLEEGVRERMGNTS